MTFALTTVTLFHDSKASRKGDRRWKVTVPKGATMSEAIPLHTFDGTDGDDDLGTFEAARAEATPLVAERLGVAPDAITWVEGTDWLGHPTARFDLTEVLA